MNALSQLGWLYGLGTAGRNALYDGGVFKSYSLGAKTISVGNITAGGTGKTPLVAHIAEILAANGEKVCILTRGYGRENPDSRVLVSNGDEVLVDAAIGGDEPVELARKLIGKAVVVADADRVAAGLWAKEEFGVTAFVLDDGFQHRRVKRDLDIVCIDATDPFGGGEILPAGLLREWPSSLARAEAVVVTRADMVDNVGAVVERVRGYNESLRVFTARNSLRGVTALEESAGDAAVEELESCPVYAFCGIANPENFFAMLRAGGVDLRGAQAFRDHHRYTREDIDKLEHEAEWAGAKCLITTAKDAVKLVDLKLQIPCLVAELEVRIDDPGGFRSLVLSL